jgi:hypothetical protein
MFLRCAGAMAIAVSVCALVSGLSATPATASAIPITLVQQSSNASIGPTSILLTLPSSIAAGDALVASFNNTHDGLTIVSISGGGVSWQLVNQENDTAWGTADSEVWYGRNSTGGPSTITVNLSGTTNSTFYALNVSEWSGLGGIDASPAGTFDHSGTSPVAAAPATSPTTSGDLFIGVAGSTGAAEEVGAGPPGGGFTAFPIASGIFHSAYGYLVAHDAATHQYTQPLTQAGDWSATAAAFYPSSVPPSAPSVSAVSPSSGSTAGGTAVTITGTNFTGATAVRFGSTPATSFSVTGPTSISAQSPAGSLGTVDITVTTLGGTSTVGSADHFTYTTPPPPPPTVSAVSPSSGPAAGGTAVTITGTNFTGATAVRFGSTPATSFSVTGPSSISAQSPAAVGTGLIAAVQNSSSATVTSNTERITLPANVTAGDALVLAFSNTSDTINVSSVSGGGVTWTRAAVENDDAVTADSEIWYGLASSGGSGTSTITATLTSAAAKAYAVNLSEWSGVGGVDQAPAGILDHTGSSPANAPSITPTHSGDLFIGAVGANAAASGTPGGGFSALSAGSAKNVGFGRLIATDSAAHQYTQALVSASTWSGIAAAFYPAAPAATVDITVTTPGGTSTVSSADQYTYG